MTTITIPRALLEQALANMVRAELLYGQPTQAIQEAIRAALSAPATAPEQPAWHVAPTVPGLWVSDFSWMAQKLDRETVEFYAKNRSIPSRRWYGPIPEEQP